MKRLAVAAIFCAFLWACGSQIAPQLSAARTTSSSSQPSSCGYYPNPCARTDFANTPAFSVPNVGGLTGANKGFQEPLSNEWMTRLTDYNTTGSSKGAGYITTSSGSAEQTLMDISDHYIVIESQNAAVLPFTWNPSTMQAQRMYVSQYPSTNGIELQGIGPEFSRVKSGLVYAIQNTSSTPKLVSYDLTSPAPPNATTLYNFQSCGSIGSQLAGHTQWTNDLSVSANDAVFATAFSTTGSQGTGVYVLSWSRGGACHWYNTSTGQTDVGPVKMTGSESNPDLFYIHNVRMGPGGWVRITRQSCINSCQSDETMYLWQPGTDQVSTTATSGHQAIGYNKYATNDGYQGAYGCLYPQCMTTAPVTNPSEMTELWKNGPGTPTGSWDCHLSWANDQPSDTMPLISSSISNVEVPTLAWQNEIDGFTTDGSGKVYRYARHYNSENPGETFDALNAIGSVSEDGRWYLITSDWGCTLGSTSGGSTGTQSPYNCRSDVFVLQLK